MIHVYGQVKKERPADKATTKASWMNSTDRTNPVWNDVILNIQNNNYHEQLWSMYPEELKQKAMTLDLAVSISNPKLMYTKGRKNSPQSYHWTNRCPAKCNGQSEVDCGDHTPKPPPNIWISSTCRSLLEPKSVSAVNYGADYSRQSTLNHVHLPLVASKPGSDTDRQAGDTAPKLMTGPNHLCQSENGVFEIFSSE